MEISTYGNKSAPQIRIESNSQPQWLLKYLKPEECLQPALHSDLWKHTATIYHHFKLCKATHSAQKIGYFRKLSKIIQPYKNVLSSLNLFMSVPHLLVFWAPGQQWTYYKRAVWPRHATIESAVNRSSLVEIKWPKINRSGMSTENSEQINPALATKIK